MPEALTHAFPFVSSVPADKPSHYELALELPQFIRFTKMNRSQKENIGKTLGLVLLLVAPVAAGQTNSPAFEPALSKDRPLLELNLRNYGYRPHVRGRGDRWSLAFADNNELVLGWTTLDDPSADEKTGPLTPAPSHLHALVLDARIGQKKNIQQWPTSSFFATINPVAEGRFLVCTGTAIQLLSHDFGLIREQPLSRFSPCIADEVSPSRRSFSIDTGMDKNYQRTLIDAESFKPLATWSKEALNVHFTDSLLVGNCRPKFEVCVRGISQPWQPFEFPDMDEQMGHSKRIIPFFVNDSTLVLTVHRDLAVVTVEGTLLFRLSLPNKYSFGSTATSAGGERFAIIETKMRGVTNEVWDMYAFPADDHVVVYSLHEGTTIYARKITGTSPWPPWIEHKNRLALSPDGSLLAIFDDGILTVYQLPAPKS
jgi:hypothetical protein